MSGFRRSGSVALRPRTGMVAPSGFASAALEYAIADTLEVAFTARLRTNASIGARRAITYAIAKSTATVSDGYPPRKLRNPLHGGQAISRALS
jgi:hypothetical protein